MPLEPDDFIAPVGLLTPDLFPDGDIEVRVATWLSEAEGKAPASEPAQRAWVYYRGYFDVWQRLSSNPASLSLDGTSMSMGQEQIASYRTLWMRLLADFNQAMGAPTTRPLRSSSEPAVAKW